MKVVSIPPLHNSSLLFVAVDSEADSEFPYHLQEAKLLSASHCVEALPRSLDNKIAFVIKRENVEGKCNLEANRLLLSARSEVSRSASSHSGLLTGN